MRHAADLEGTTKWQRWKDQFKILVWKNWLLTRRGRRKLLIQLLAPVVIVILLIVIQVSISTSQGSGSDFRTVKTFAGDAVQSVSPCYAAPARNGECWDFVWAPASDALAASVAQAIADQNDPPLTKVRGFASADDIDAYILANKNVTQAGVLFDFSERDAQNRVILSYTLQYNTTTIWYHGIRTSPFDYVVVPLQQAVERQLLKLVSDDPNTVLDVDMVKYAHPDISQVNAFLAAGSLFILGALMFTFVIILTQVVTEKELKIQESMRQMGMIDSAYWLSWAVVHFIAITVAVILICITGAACQFDFFLKNNFFLYFLLLWLFGWSLIPLAYLMSAFLNKAAQANTAGFLVLLVSLALQIVAAILLSDNASPLVRGLLSLLSPALLSKGIDDLASFTTGVGQGMSWSQRFDYPTAITVGDAHLLLILDTAIYSVLAWYFVNVWPKDYGTSRSPGFFFQKSYWTGRREPAPLLRQQPGPKPETMDQRVYDEQCRVMRGEVSPDDAAIIVTGLEKEFLREPKKRRQHCCSCCCCCCDRKTIYRAVRGLWYHVPRRGVFCLLGPNGAGKSTTISILTGVMQSTNGDAQILGSSVSTSMDDIRAFIGICPQFDILYNDLTAMEHLTLFATLKGVPAHHIAAEARDRLDEVDLLAVADRCSVAYSGGMRRRLSVAVALCGDPRVIFLDEPTTGMDVISRRHVWNVIQRAKEGRLIVLTTHSMEEAEVLGDQIAIMAFGQMKVLGSSLVLKKECGSGFTFTIELREIEYADGLTAFVCDRLEPLHEPSLDGPFLTFKFAQEAEADLATLFRDVQAHEDELGVLSVGVTETSLEEVFLRVAEQSKQEEQAMLDEGESVDWDQQ